MEEFLCLCVFVYLSDSKSMTISYATSYPKIDISTRGVHWGALKMPQNCCMPLYFHIAVIGTIFKLHILSLEFDLIYAFWFNSNEQICSVSMTK